ncbi:MaoC family dehydratase [Alcanivorax quisquiliarum]|uniref:Acyl dehydratase n=1 Tax=Alcanivorax quisquiliarum TaxID=2933565 RepID=A0ABT0E9W1_9GAMM|nr:MaoC/PaaZ C-terminal domain-containing protein [Alcanivorax quisquiliarum]MCK0538627.1 acyl dehydratase [Alcanivorax quisquiliarum]
MTSTEIRELRNAPAMLPLFAKAVIRAGVKPGKAPALPDIGIRLRDVVLDSKHLATYRKVCAFPADGHLPVTYPHLHAHPLFMSLLLHEDFPFAAMGLVHVRNRITQYRRINEREQLDVECSFGELVQVEKGYEFSILTHVSTGGELVWESESTMFRRGGGSGGGQSRKTPPETTPAENFEEWKVPADAGRRYGAVSGDRNPIHLYPLTAKLFGFKRQIVHGMWSKARCLAALHGQLPDGAFTVDVQFKLPMFIPATVKFVQEDAADGIDFRLLAKDGVKPHLTGTIRSAG